MLKAIFAFCGLERTYLWLLDYFFQGTNVAAKPAGLCNGWIAIFHAWESRCREIVTCRCMLVIYLLENWRLCCTCTCMSQTLPLPEVHVTISMLWLFSIDVALGNSVPCFKNYRIHHSGFSKWNKPELHFSVLEELNFTRENSCYFCYSRWWMSFNESSLNYAPRMFVQAGL